MLFMSPKPTPQQEVVQLQLRSSSTLCFWARSKTHRNIEHQGFTGHSMGAGIEDVIAPLALAANAFHQFPI